MTSVIGGIEETIAKTMGDIGWPGADLVAEQVVVVEEANEEDHDEEKEHHLDKEELQEEKQEENEEEPPEEVVAEEKKPPPYQPKWKKAALEVLGTLTEEQQELLRAEDKRREENFHKGIEQYRDGHKNAKEWDEAVAPYRATFDQFGLKPAEAVRNLLSADHVLRYGQPHQKIGTILQAIQSYGINPQDVVSVLQSVAPGVQSQGQQIDPSYAQLDQRLRQFEQSQLQYQQQQELQRQQQEKNMGRDIEQQISTFADNPDHEHFELLRPLMAGLIQSGTAKDLTEAYDMAYKSHPTTAALYVAEQQKKWNEEKKAAVEKAKKVTNVRSNGRASVSMPTHAGSMEDTIRIEAQRLGLM